MNNKPNTIEIKKILTYLFEDGANAQYRFGGMGEYSDFDKKKKIDVENALVAIHQIIEKEKERINGK